MKVLELKQIQKIIKSVDPVDSQLEKILAQTFKQEIFLLGQDDRTDILTIPRNVVLRMLREAYDSGKDQRDSIENLCQDIMDVLGNYND